MTGAHAIGARAQSMIDALAAITAEPDKLTRLCFSDEHKRAARLVADWMGEAGLSVRMDAAGTIHGLMAAERAGVRSGRRLLVGSHIDTVIDAGRYDGNLGIVAGIIAAEELKKRSIALPFDLEVLAFGDEEGVRFPKTLLGSSAIAGTIEPEMLDLTDADGVSIRDALTSFGGDPQGLSGAGYSNGDLIGYLEVHIEQGPVLDNAGEALGVVTAIASQGRYRLLIKGEAGHAGTVPMALRRDALAAAAEVIAIAEAIGRRGEKSSLVCTVGEISVRPGASNVIPGEASFSLDIRGASDEARKDAVDTIRGAIRQVGARRGVVIGMETMMEKPVVPMAPGLRKAIAAGITSVIGHRPRELMSGAGHDGQAMAHLTDVGMIFVRCRAGISHSPLEFVSVEDQGLAIEALIRTVEEIGKSVDRQLLEAGD
jgi:allantoate deiminase